MTFGKNSLKTLVSNSSIKIGSINDDEEFFLISSDAAARFIKTNPNLKSRTKVVNVEPASWQEFHEDAAFEREKYLEYIPLLSRRMSEIHGVKLPNIYWERCMGFTLLMHISNCLRIYKIALLSGLNQYRIAVPGAMSMPNSPPRTEKEYRDLFQYSESGDSALLNCYANMFFDKNCLHYMPAKITKSNKEGAKQSKSRFGKLKRVWNFKWNILGYLAVKLLRLVVNPTVLAAQVYWNRRERYWVELISLGKIRVEPVLSLCPTPLLPIDWQAREKLSEFSVGISDFDRFFFASLNFSAPQSWLEGWQTRRTSASSLLSRYGKLRHIINESLDEDSLLLMAEASAKGVTTILCEHNWLQFQFLGNFIWYMQRKVDRFWTLGWHNEKTGKTEASGSFFEWMAPKSRVANIDLLYVSGVSLVKAPASNAGYLAAGSNNAAKYLYIKKIFFSALPQDLISKIYYRDYPEWRRKRLGVHFDDEEVVRTYGSQFFTVDDKEEEGAIQLIARSKIVITDYLSTTYIQSILSDVPTIVLFNENTMYLDSEHHGFFDRLVEAKIFHSNPLEAARFLEQISESPRLWWDSPSVVEARHSFISRNIGSSDALRRKLLDLR